MDMYQKRKIRAEKKASDDGCRKTNINWYPGHMAAAKRMMEENLKLIDVIIELRDARIPYSSGNPDIEKFNKPRIIVLSKADLADKNKTKKWTEYFKANGISAVAVNSRNRQSEVCALIEMACREKTEYFASKGIHRNIRGLVAGIPNSGKSTLINSLCGAQRAKTGDKPGITRGKQWIKAGNIDLLDSPGILWPRLENQTSARYLAYTGALNDEILDLDELALDFIKVINQKYPKALENRYGIVSSGEAIEDYEAICRKRGFLIRGGECDYSRLATVLLDEFRSGKLGNITLEEPSEL